MTPFRFRSAAAALVLTLAAGLGTAASADETPVAVQAQATDITGAIAAYNAAQASYTAAQDSGGDVVAAQAELDAAAETLGTLCATLGIADIEACIAAVDGEAGLAVEGATEAEPPATADDTAPAQEPVAEEPAPADAPAATEPAPEQPAAEPAPAEAPAAEAPADAIAAAPEPLAAAVADYEAANAALAEASASGADINAPYNDLTAARARIDELCATLGQTDTTACLAAFGIELTAAAVPPATEPAAEAPQPAEAPAAEEPAPVEEPAAEEPAPADAPAAEEPALEQPVAEAPAAEAEPELNPSGTPIPRELSRALAAYEEANRALAASVVGTPEADAAGAGVEAARKDIQALCEQDGQPDIAACLDAYGAALTPMATPMEAEAAAKAETEASAAAAPENEAPLLDSEKDAQSSGTAAATAEPTSEPAAEPAADQPPPPESDAEAQADVAPEQIPSIEAEQGTRTEANATAAPQRQQPENAEVVGQSGPRIVIRFGGQTYVDNPSDRRIDYGASDRYVEDLSRGRTRETVVRPDGTRLVTVYNRYGDILRRSYFDRSGEEAVLSYVPESYYENSGDWRDPGDDLPPLRLGIPRQDYVLNADEADLDTLTRFLDAPPVERVQRLYSVDDVKRSARLRDMVRRLEIGNLTFGFGSASIPPNQIGALSIVANAMLDLIEENPAETFLIEGHTDAVGSDTANLILSDERAYTVAVALTEVFGVPPENIATQGYGERYLKVQTLDAERANRRVTIRRITPLVAPANGNMALN